MITDDTKNQNWWRRRTTLERCLTLATVFACIVVIGLISGLVVVSTKNKAPEEVKPPNNKDSHACLTSECIHTASAVLSKIKPVIEPCDDFFQFACGNFIDETQIPEDKVSMDTFSAISDKLQEQLKDIITEERPTTDPKHLRLPNQLYKSCMNKSQIESSGTKPIKQISDSLGGWPVIVGQSWDSDNSWTWQETVKKFRQLGLSEDYVISIGIDVDFKDSKKRIIELDQSSIGLSRQYLVKGFNEPFVAAYYDYMVDIAVLFGADKETAKKELKESLQFEMDLANISWPMEKRRNYNDLYNLRTVKQLQEAYPYVQWVDYINGILPDTLTIDENEVINLSVPSFFDDLGKLLGRTKKRAIANYMMWRIHSYSVDFMPEVFRKRRFQYITVLTGRQEEEAQWKDCVNTATNRVSISVGSLYVRKHFNEESKAIASEMVENIRGAFSQILDEVQWMDEITKQEAHKKLRAMTTHIGYPDELLDNKKLEEYYRLLEIDSDKYFESHLNMNIFGNDRAYNKLRLPVNKTDWETHSYPAVVNAFYSSIENSIQFPAGILQGHFFNSQRPKYMNYGAIGFVMGHEITHGFDDQGRQFDLEGNLVDWWQPDTKKAFLQKAQCIIEQYGNFTDKQTGLNVNGINTQGENIADNGGIKESYMAYNKWAEESGEEPKLPGLSYTPNQMFWISAAQSWCAKYRTETLKNRITTGVHSPAEFRVLGPLSNMKFFAKDFQCREGAPMNPVHKCEVW